MVEVQEGTFDPVVAPGRVLLSHADDEALDGLYHARAAWGAALEGPLQGNQAAMPTHDRVGRNDVGHLVENLTAECLSLDSKACTLGIGES